MAYDNPEDDPIVQKLTSIDSTLKALLALAMRRQPKVKAIADDRELDSQYGNPLVKFHPRDWTGLSMKGQPMSECDADFLDMLAETFDYFAEVAEGKNDLANNGKPVAPYKRKDAARARGWAKRIRDGKVPASASTGSEWGQREEDF